MKVGRKFYRTIWLKKGDAKTVQLIDQRSLPHRFQIENIHSSGQMAAAIRDMHLRGAPLIGVAAAFGMYLACLEAGRKKNFETSLQDAAVKLKKTRPTAVNLQWAVDRQLEVIRQSESVKEKIKAALSTACQMADEDAQVCHKIGEHGLTLIQDISRKRKGNAVNILTHCNAGWLACVDWGTATSPIYQAYDQGIKIHVWVDETRPRNQGASLTAWELGQHGVPHTVIVDNAGGHLMQHGKVDLVLVGTDRTTRRGDIANKIGTYLKALAARDNGIPFYVALPSSSIDWKIRDGLREIWIEERNPDEVRYIQGWDGKKIREVLLTPKKSRASNYGFDVTPASLVSGLITERGLCEASEQGLLKLFPERT